ncbi:MAG: hypothetical protein AAF492_16380 [Verrucomicrobiota bacterium]
MIAFRSIFYRFPLLLGLLGFGLPGDVAQGQEHAVHLKNRWQSGMVYSIKTEVAQATRILKESKLVDQSITLTQHHTVKVEAAAGNRQKITVDINRVHYRIQSGSGPDEVFDSRSPSAGGAEAATIQSWLTEPFDFLVDENGRLIELTRFQHHIDRHQRAGALSANHAMVNKAMKMVQGTSSFALNFPEKKIKAGHSWKVEAPDVPGHSDYTYEGMKLKDKILCAQISMASDYDVGGDSRLKEILSAGAKKLNPVNFSVKKLKRTGKLFFDHEAGAVKASSVTQICDMELIDPWSKKKFVMPVIQVVNTTLTGIEPIQ